MPLLFDTYLNKETFHSKFVPILFSIVPDVCQNGYYGSDCILKCNCVKQCDTVTGECPNQECQPGYTIYPGNVTCQGMHYTQ